MKTSESDCGDCKEATWSLSTSQESIDNIGKVLIKAGILFKEQFELIKERGKGKNITLLQFDSNYIKTITELLHANKQNDFKIQKNIIK